MSLPNLVLVPGLMCDDEVWAHQARALAALTSVHVADHRMLDSLEAMGHAILQRAPQRFALAGHSMGGRVAFEVFRQAPQRVAGLALLDTNYQPRSAGAEGDSEAANRYALLEVAQREGVRAMASRWVQDMVHPARLTDTVLVEAIISMMERKTAEIFESQIHALLNRPDATPVLSQIRCPTLVLCGRQDTWSVVARHDEMAALIPESRLVIIEECGHMSTMERPEAVTRTLRDWLTSLSA